MADKYRPTDWVWTKLHLVDGTEVRGYYVVREGWGFISRHGRAWYPFHAVVAAERTEIEEED